jgi:hypothetical protein
MESSEFGGAFEKKKIAPRRRRPAAADETPEDESVPAPSAGSKKGWGESDDNDGAAAPARRRRAPLEDEVDTSTVTRNQHDDDSDGETPIIPDLEDEQEDMARQVAAAPNLASSRVQNIKELDEAIDMTLPAAGEIGVDLGVLQSFLTPQEHVREEDVPWDVDKELAALASQLEQEKEALMEDGSATKKKS